MKFKKTGKSDKKANPLKRVLKMLVICLGIVSFCYIGINVYAYLSGIGHRFAWEEIETMEKGADAILVLGAGVRSDGKPSSMLEDRLLTAVELFEKGISDTVIVSGDHGQEDYDEVNAMKKYLIQKGIPSNRIFMDHAGFSTYDSLYRAREVFGAKDLVIVTQYYHSHRALMIGKHLGLSCRSVAAPILSAEVEVYRGQIWYSFRESIARCKDFAWSLIQPKPRYLGERISLEANGDITEG